MNDIKAGIFRPRPIESKIYDPCELAREAARKFAADFADKLNTSNIYSFIDEAKKYVLSDNNIARAKAPAVKYDNADTIRNPQQTRHKV